MSQELPPQPMELSKVSKEYISENSTSDSKNLESQMESQIVVNNNSKRCILPWIVYVISIIFLIIGLSICVIGMYIFNNIFNILLFLGVPIIIASIILVSIGHQFWCCHRRKITNNSSELCPYIMLDGIFVRTFNLSCTLLLSFIMLLIISIIFAITGIVVKSFGGNSILFYVMAVISFIIGFPLFILYCILACLGRKHVEKVTHNQPPTVERKVECCCGEIFIEIARRILCPCWG